MEGSVCSGFTFLKIINYRILLLSHRVNQLSPIKNTFFPESLYGYKWENSSGKKPLYDVVYGKSFEDWQLLEDGDIVNFNSLVWIHWHKFIITLFKISLKRPIASSALWLRTMRSAMLRSVGCA